MGIFGLWVIIIINVHSIIVTYTPLFKKMLCYTGSFLLYPGFSPVGVTGGYALAEVCRLLIVVAPLVAEHGLQDMQASARASFSSCGPQA